MTIDEIKKLVEIVRETGISELEVKMGDGSVKIRNQASGSKELVLPTVLPVSVSSTIPGHALAMQGALPAAAPGESVPAAPTVEEDQKHLVVKSPIVGTYYDSPSPGAPAFVKIGDRVEPKQVLCIIESMKLMNEIESEVSGTVVAKHVENARPVEYGESLFTIRPH
jgi:acetyl-CoA carboxylase biotin carboxyl carrier protein